MTSDFISPFIDETLQLEPTGSGALNGLTFATKDLFDVAGHVTGAGNPDWVRTHGAATANAAVIDQLLAAGAALQGKTHTDELAFSLNGENHHFGTPLNPRAPGRIPGGSSGGSASAVASGLVDFALGTDTGGSVRVPASHCGIYGLRTTHDLIPRDGLVPLAPSYDTVGWFADDAQTMADVLYALTAQQPEPPARDVLIIAETLGELSADDRKAFIAFASEFCETLGYPLRAIRITAGEESTQSWATAFRLIQLYEIGRTHQDWIAKTAPVFGPGIRERFEMAVKTFRENTADPAPLKAARAVRTTVRKRLGDLTGNGAILLMPSAPAPAPLPSNQLTAMDDYRERAMRLTSPAGLAGLPQLSCPYLQTGDLPLGVSLLGAENRERGLIDTVLRFESELARVA